MLSPVITGAVGCAGGGAEGERVGQAGSAAGRSVVAGASSTRPEAGPTRTTKVISFPVGSWRPLPPSPPVGVEIPSIGVSSPLVRLGLNRDRSMEVPGNFQVAGWFTGGPQPGQLGPAVIAGHVDSPTGPAVFFRLRDLRPGDQVRVVRADHRVVRFEVDSLASYPKQALPTEAVYGATTAPVLRLITCAGRFDRASGSYRNNLVVSATRVPDGKEVAR